MTAAVQRRATSIVVLPSLLLLFLLLAAGCNDSPSAPPDAGPLPMEQCIGASDLAIIGSLGTAPDGGVPDGGPYPYSYLRALGDEVEACSTADTCLPDIIADDQPEQCINDCLATTPAMGISTGCVGCYVEIMRCIAQHCTTLCLGSDPVLCETCSYENCGARMAECTGITGMP